MTKLFCIKTFSTDGKEPYYIKGEFYNVLYNYGGETSHSFYIDTNSDVGPCIFTTKPDEEPH